MKYRIEKDSMGEIRVPDEHYWGAQTERSRHFFHIGKERMPYEVIYAFSILKEAAAEANYALERLSKEHRDAIVAACTEIQKGKWYREFPLMVWQTGSGTQTNMNVNEVISRRGNEILGKQSLHPNDHVNLSQSSNDTFPTAMHIAALLGIQERILPALNQLKQRFAELEGRYADLMKSGRTHLQDATPLTFGQEISGWRGMLEKNEEQIRDSMKGLCELAIGGTAVGTGLNAPEGFARRVADYISTKVGIAVNAENNKFHALTSKDAMVFSHGALKALAANDIRWLSSGPRCGLGEITIPENEPGSSIMPGKVNPTQCEALSMVAVQVIANDVAVGLAASQGNFQLNVYMPVCIYNFLQSIQLLGDSMHSFEEFCVRGMEAKEDKMKENMEKSLMNATALTPYLGYDKVAILVKKAHRENKTLEQACLELGLMGRDEFRKAMNYK